MTASGSGPAPQHPKHERKKPPLDPPPRRGTLYPPGSLLDENPGSTLSGNQHYDILQAPHHCSWHSLSYDSYSTYGEDAEVCDDARSALAQIRKGAIIVASSKAIDPDEADPPSDRAKREYISIVDGKSDRFICVADVWEDEERALQYEITSSGITKVVKSAAKAAVAALGIGATAAQARPHG